MALFRLVYANGWTGPARGNRAEIRSSKDDKVEKPATPATMLMVNNLRCNSWFFAVFGGTAEWFSGTCGWASQSQRDCSYQPRVARDELPGASGTEFTTLKGSDPLLSRWDSTPSGLRSMSATTQGRPSPSRANLGLDDPIPLGLKHPRGGSRGGYRVPFHRKQRGTQKRRKTGRGEGKGKAKR